MQTEWEPDELIGTWTLGTDWDLIANKAGATRIGFAAMLKFYEVEGRFPAYREEVPPAVVRYLGSLVKVDPALYARYPWTGRSIKYHKAQIRKVYGTRPPTEDDEERWARWLAEEICPAETSRDRLAAAHHRCRRGSADHKALILPRGVGNRPVAGDSRRPTASQFGRPRPRQPSCCASRPSAAAVPGTPDPDPRLTGLHHRSSARTIQNLGGSSGPFRRAPIRRRRG